MYRFILFTLICLFTITLALSTNPLALAQPEQPSEKIEAEDETPGTPPAQTPGVPAETAEPREEPLLPEVSPGIIVITTPPLITALEFRGNTVISSADLADATGLELGKVAAEGSIEAAIENIEDLYHNRGYIGAVVNLDIPEQPEGGPLVFYIQELRISEIRLEGLRRVSPGAIDRIITTEEGDIYYREQVIQDYLRLQQLGVFEELTFDLEPVETGEAILVWRFQELQQFNYVSLGGSYGPSDGLVGTLDLTLGNLGGRGEKLRTQVNVSSVDGRVGGQLNYLNPWIGRDTSLLLNAYSNVIYRFSRDIIAGPVSDRYAERHTGFSAFAERIVKPTFTLTPGIRYEDVNIYNIPEDTLTTLSQDSTIGFGSLRATWDRRDSVISPTTGTYTIGFFEGGFADQETTGTDGIAKLWGDRRWYLPLRDPMTDEVTGLPTRMVPVLAVRALLAGSLGDLPFFEQYFVGGISDLPLRGYLQDRFWGKYALVANAELRFPITQTLAWATFVDVGDAWASDFEFAPGEISDDFLPQHDSFSPRIGAGVGIRYATPAGPIRLDFAYGDEFRTYLSVGQQF